MVAPIVTQNEKNYGGKVNMRKGLIWLWGIAAATWVIPNFTGGFDMRNVLLTCTCGLLAVHNYLAYKRGE